MFEQMSAERFETMRNGVGLSPDDACSALEELLLYRELGTLQQLSLATDAVGEARTLRARVAELEEEGATLRLLLVEAKRTGTLSLDLNERINAARS